MQTAKPQISLKCPACQHALLPMSAGELSLYACQGCAGLWFSSLVYKQRLFRAQLSTLDQLNRLPKDPAIQINRTQQLSCPRCYRMALRQTFFSQEKQAQVNECLKCGGVWLHGGELRKILQENEGKQKRLLEAEQRTERLREKRRIQEEVMNKQGIMGKLFPSMGYKAAQSYEPLDPQNSDFKF